MNGDDHEMKRVVSLEYLRVFACCLVVFCHFTQSIGHVNWAGALSGGVGNCLFFIISGLVLGMKWREGGSQPLGAAFLEKRFLRLYPAFAIVVVIYALFLLLIAGLRIPIWSMLLNLCGLSWFSKLPGAGHLWFVTGIGGFYVLLLVASRMVSHKGMSAVCVGLVALHIGLAELKIPQAYYCTLLLGGVIAFFCGRVVTHARLSIRRPWVCALGLFVAVAVYVLLCYLVCGIQGSHVLFYWLSFVCAVFFAGWCMLSECRLPAPPRFVGFVSSISYEVYLVHHPLCLGPLSLKNVCPSVWSYLIAFTLITLLLSYVLHIMVVRLYGWLK